MAAGGYEEYEWRSIYINISKRSRHKRKYFMPCASWDFLICNRAKRSELATAQSHAAETRALNHRRPLL